MLCAAWTVNTKHSTPYTCSRIRWAYTRVEFDEHLYAQRWHHFLLFLFFVRMWDVRPFNPQCLRHREHKQQQEAATIGENKNEINGRRMCRILAKNRNTIVSSVNEYRGNTCGYSIYRIAANVQLMFDNNRFRIARACISLRKYCQSLRNRNNNLPIRGSKSVKSFKKKQVKNINHSLNY